MSNMGKYCKAYSVKNLRAFPSWIENAENTRIEKKEIDGKETEEKRVLRDDSFLYVQENYHVTDGIYKDENIIFDQISEEWKSFCQKELQFKIPDWEKDPN